MHGQQNFKIHEKLMVHSKSGNSPHFMKPEGSLKHSQGRDSCPYLGPARSSPTVPKPHFLTIHLIIYLPSTTVFQVVSVPQVSPPTLCICTTLHHTLYMLRPSHSSRFYHPNNIGRGEQIIKLLLM